MADLNNLDDNGNQISHPEIVSKVLEEVKGINTNYAKAKEEREKLAGDVESLKELVADKALGDRVDPLVKEQVTKLTDIITAKQNELDLAAHNRIDALDLAVQKVGKTFAYPQALDPALVAENTRQFEITCLSRKSGATNRTVKTSLKGAPDVEQYSGYKNAFNSYITQPGEQNNAMLSPEELRIMSVGQDPDGGYWVPIEQSNRIIQRLFEVDPVRQLAGGITISSDRMKMMVDVDDLGTADTYWQGEKTAITETGTPQTGIKEIVAGTLITEPKITQQLLEDAIINPEQWLADKIASKYERVEGAAFVTGDGINKPRGFLTYGSTWAEGTGGIGNIELISMGHASQLTTDGFTKVMYSLLEGFLFRGTWLMNRLAVRDAMLLKDGDGQYIWRTGLQAGQPSVILTVPVRMSTTMPVIAANALSVAIADWREAYLVVDRIGISTMRDPFTAKPFILFYTRKRVGGDVVNYQAIKIGKVSV